jgi:hypothetical protein
MIGAHLANFCERDGFLWPSAAVYISYDLKSPICGRRKAVLVVTRYAWKRNTLLDRSRG